MKLAVLAAGIHPGGQGRQQGRVKLMPAESGRQLARSRVLILALSPAAIISPASSSVLLPHSGNSGVIPVPANCCSR